MEYTLGFAEFLNLFPSGLDLEIFFKFSLKIINLYGQIHQKSVAEKRVALVIHPRNFFVNGLPGKSNIDDYELSSNLLPKNPEENENDQFEATSEEVLSQTQDQFLDNILYFSPEFLSSAGLHNRTGGALMLFNSDKNTAEHKLREIYAFGVLSYKILTAVDPFMPDVDDSGPPHLLKSSRILKLEEDKADSLDPLDIYHLHLAKTPKVITAIRKDVPRILSDIVNLCLEKEPSKRYQTFSGLEYDLTKAYDAWKIKRSSPEVEKTAEEVFLLRTKDFIKSGEGEQEEKQKRNLNFDVFIGRNEEMKIVEAAIQQLEEKRISVLVVEGKSGLGLQKIDSFSYFHVFLQLLFQNNSQEKHNLLE